MKDEEIARLTAPQLIELIKKLADELETRLMELTEDKQH